MKTFNDIEYKKGLHLDLTIPETDQFDVFVYFHGGGLVKGDKGSYCPLYSPMLFIVSTNDMFNRYEQTMLMINTLKHFGHENNVKSKVLDGTHCHYVKKIDEDGYSSFAKMVCICFYFKHRFHFLDSKNFYKNY